MCNKYNLLPQKISVIQIKNKIRIYFTIISKIKRLAIFIYKK